MNTLVDLLGTSAQRWPRHPAVSLLERHPWDWNYETLLEISRRTGAYLRAAGVRPGDRVVLWGPNRPEWVAGFFGIQLAGGIAVPWDPSSSVDVVAEHTQPKHILLGEEQRATVKGGDAQLTPLEEQPGRAAAIAPLPEDDCSIAPGQVAQLVFTSGTTGVAKAVALTHANLLANVGFGRSAFPPTPDNRVLSILPLSHVFEQVAGLLVPMSGGASIAYIDSLRPDTIFSAVEHFRVTNMACVPRVLQVFREGIEREVRRQGRAAQFERLLRLSRHLPFAARRLLFRPIHKRLGGAFQYFVCGGAYLDPELARWWEALGIKVAQGYGLTETAPVVATNTLNDRDPTSVGRPPAGVQVQIAGDGEILVRGQNVTPGYWRNPAATEAAFVDGWFKTGDLGFLDHAGRLHLHGRKKDLIVLANGLKVHPEDIEQVVLRDPWVKDVVVLGQARGQNVELHAVLLTDDGASAPEIVRTSNRNLPLHQRIQRYSVWPEETFPLSTTLKPKRHEVAARLAELGTGALSAERARR